MSRHSPQNFPQIPISVTNSTVAAIGAAFPANQVPNWLLAGITGSGNSYTLFLDPVPTLMPNGTSTATVLVGATDASGRVLESHEVRVSVEVFDGVHFGPGFNNMTMTFGGDETAVYQLGLTANGAQSYTLTSDVPWVALPAGARQGSGSIPATINSSTLPIGVNTARITAQNPSDPADRHSTAIFVDIAGPNLQLNPTTVYVGGEQGVEPLSANVTVSLNTGGRSHPWTAQFVNLPIAAAMSLPTPGGMVSGTSAVSFAVNGDRSQVAPGRHTGRLRVEATVRGLVFAREVDLVVNRETQRLFPRYDGVAFSSFPGRSMLTRTIIVADSHRRLGVPWSATSSVPWLAVSPASGVTGDSITITADAVALAADQFHAGIVTLSSSDPGVERSETIRAGLWKGSTDPVDHAVPMTARARSLITNPVEPWVYTIADDGVVQVIHQYTGTSLANFATGVGTRSTLAVSSDGRLLYVADGQTPRTLEIDGTTGASLREFTAPADARTVSGIGTSVLAYIRLNAHPTLWQPFAGGREPVRPVDLETGLPLLAYTANGGGINSDILSIYDEWQLPSVDGEYLYTGNHNGFGVARRNYSVLRGPSFTYVPGEYYMRLSDVLEFCAGSDGRIYHATGLHSEIQAYEPNLANSTIGPFALPARAVGIACGWDGRKYVTIEAATPMAANLFVFDGDGATQSLRVGASPQIYPRSLKLSGDGRRLVWQAYESGNSPLMFSNAP